MLDTAALKDIRPFVATPSYSGAMASLYVRSLLGLVNAAWTHGFAMQTRFLDGDSLLTRARNRLVAEFMADAQWTHLFWIDADVGFTPDAALRLLLSGRDVVAGVYPHKHDGWPAQGLARPLPAGATQADFDALHARYPLNLRHTPTQADADGFVEVLDAPTGFMLIARGVFERMAAAMPELRYTPRGRRPRQCAPAALALLRHPVRARHRPLPERGLRLLPALAATGRPRVRRPAVAPVAPGPEDLARGPAARTGRRRRPRPPPMSRHAPGPSCPPDRRIEGPPHPQQAPELLRRQAGAGRAQQLVVQPLGRRQAGL